MSHTIQLHSGDRFDLLNPQNTPVKIEDIAHALSHLCRFTGHTRQFYSVAQHSVLVSSLVPEQYALAGLLHDAVEAIVGDVASPLKALLPEYKRIESNIEQELLAQFGVTEMPSVIKLMDTIALYMEQRDLMPMGALSLEGGVSLACHWENPVINPLISMYISPLPPKEAKRLFLLRFKELYV